MSYRIINRKHSREFLPEQFRDTYDVDCPVPGVEVSHETTNGGYWVAQWRPTEQPRYALAIGDRCETRKEALAKAESMLSGRELNDWHYQHGLGTIERMKAYREKAGLPV